MVVVFLKHFAIFAGCWFAAAVFTALNNIIGHPREISPYDMLASVALWIILDYKEQNK